jgi:hypothetical protein
MELIDTKLSQGWHDLLDSGDRHKLSSTSRLLSTHVRVSQMKRMVSVFQKGPPRLNIYYGVGKTGIRSMNKVIV